VAVAKSGLLYVGMPEYVAAVDQGKKPATIKLLAPKEFLKPHK
jgi:hypothetical protein